MQRKIVGCNRSKMHGINVGGNRREMQWIIVSGNRWKMQWIIIGDRHILLQHIKFVAIMYIATTDNGCIVVCCNECVFGSAFFVSFCS